MTQDDQEREDQTCAGLRVTRRAVLAGIFGSGGLLAISSETDASQAAYVDAGPVTEFRRGTVTRVVLPVTFNQEVIYVFAPNNQPLVAFSARCTHQGCVVAWEPDGHRFLCPCHGGRFDQVGRNVAGPPRRPLLRLQTHQAHGRLLVEAPPLTSSSGD